MILPNGTIVDTFYDYGTGQRVPDAVAAPRTARPAAASRDGARVATINATGPIDAVDLDQRRCDLVARATRSSTTAAATPTECAAACSPPTSMPVTHRMYVAYEGGVGNTDPVYLTCSTTASTGRRRCASRAAT